MLFGQFFCSRCHNRTHGVWFVAFRSLRAGFLFFPSRSTYHLFVSAASLKPFWQDCFNNIDLFDRKFGLREDLAKGTSASLKLVQLYIERDYSCPPVIFKWQGGWDSIFLPMVENGGFAKWPTRTLARFIASLCNWNSPDRPCGTNASGSAILQLLLTTLSAHFDMCWDPFRVLTADRTFQNCIEFLLMDHSESMLSASHGSF